MPFFELIFVLISKNKEAMGKFFKIFPFTIIIFSSLLILEYYFQMVNFNFLEFFIHYKIILLNVIFCLALGLFKFQIKGTSLQFYYGINESIFVISGFFFLRGNSVYLSLGAPSIVARNKIESNESPNS